MKEIYRLWKEKFANKLLEEHGNTPYHREGSVLTHTLMVFNEAQFDSDFYAITALLHDIGKPKAVTYKDERKMFPGHEGLSTYMAINFLRELLQMEKIDEDDMLNILYLINMHGNLMKYKDSKKHWELYRYETEKLEWIKTFNRYDVAGRISDVEYNEVDIKCNCDMQKFENGKPIVVFTIGVPNSGKSTWLKENAKDWEVVSRDTILMEYASEKYGKGTYSELWKKLTDDDQKMIDKLLNNKIKTLQEERKNFVIDMTLVSYKSRRKMLNKIKRNYNVHYLNFLTDYEVVMERNKKRFEEEGKFIPENVIENMMKNYQMPLYGEDDRIIDITHIF